MSIEYRGESMSYTSEVQTAVELAKKGGRLNSTAQWELADALTRVSEGDVVDIAAASDREESTLLQYRRTAERWPAYDRVDGVSFSAHRVVLSHVDPRQVLIDAKRQHGNPTVEQVRRIMGLEPHKVLKYLRKAAQGFAKETTTLTEDEIESAKRMVEVIDITLGNIADMPDDNESEQEDKDTSSADIEQEQVQPVKEEIEARDEDEDTLPEWKKRSLSNTQGL